MLPAAELQPMPGGVWTGDYASSSGQWVNAAGALERALFDVPETDVLAPHRTEAGGSVIAPKGPEIDDLDWFCGPDSKDQIRAFLQYCRSGAFTIW
jgi:hypothetical protein